MKKSFLWLFAAILCVSSFTSCDKDDDSENSDPKETGGGNNGGGSSHTDYTLKQMEGYWVNSNAWYDCKDVILGIMNSSYYDSSSFLQDPVLSEGVSGYFIKEETAYEICISATSIRYSNNDVEGNHVWYTWNFPAEGKTVYFMNTVGSRYHHSCSITGGGYLEIGWNNKYKIIDRYTIKDSNNTIYVKIN